MIEKTMIRIKTIFSISKRSLLLILASVLFITLISVLIVNHFTPPNNLIMTTGFEGGSYTKYGEHYREILKRENIHLKLISSSGSIENLNRLRDKSFHVDAGFVQDGLNLPIDIKNLVSLGAIDYAPIWVFYCSRENFNYLNDLRGKRISIGPEGSGIRKFAIDMLKLSNTAAPPTVLLDLPTASANKALLAGKIDALMISGTEDNNFVKELLYAPNVKLMNFRQAEAYTRLIPALSHVVLPKGILNLEKKIPSEDIHLLASTTSLIIRKDMHPALIYLLLDAAVEIHENAGWVNKQKEFPSPKELSFPSSNYAERFYKSGRPFLLDYLPFGLAAFVDRTLLIMVPAVIILIPIVRSIPWLYSWRHRRKIYRWYRKLKNIELKIMESPEQENISSYHEMIDRIEAAINKIHVPLAFFSEVYKLQEHIDLVRGKLFRLSSQFKKNK